MEAGSRFPPSGMMVTMTGRPNSRANSKSLWSWAGTAMMAPVPYSARTKLLTNTGTFWSVRGFSA